SFSSHQLTPYQFRPLSLHDALPIYQNPATIQANLRHIGEVLEHFFANVPQDEAWRAGQENGLPWGGVRSLDEIINDEHLRDRGRSEEHTSELQSRVDLVCRLLLEKK